MTYVWIALVLITVYSLLTMHDEPIQCKNCGDPLVDHLQELTLMPDYCPKCGSRIN